MVPDYKPQDIEQKWQAKWAEDELYRVGESDEKPKWYFLTMFPYTSGDLHIGHWYAEAPADTAARFKRMQGYNVLRPIGFDAFGLPAENAAIKRNIHPFTWTIQNVENMRRQLRSLGATYDWSREVVTCLPEYYKWTEWFFLQFYKAGLAYRAKAPANWCPKCQTVLANEQVTAQGLCERCESLVTKRDLEQWFLRITNYADELLDHSKIQWPERIGLMQKNWIGRSEGAEISFGIDGYPDEDIRVFTTRPDTVYGVTFMVFAPEHPLIERLTTPDHRPAVEAYVAETRRQSEIERQSTEKEKTGVFTGAYAINRLNGEKVPIFIADYVLLSYGTGAVMAVPAHDTRDFAFAKKYGLPIPVVIAPEGWSGGPLDEAYTEAGTMVNSGLFDGTPSVEGKKKVAEYLKDKGWGGPTVNYRLRDWLISRQRYWGAPIPIVYCDHCGIVPVPEDQLPVLLPEDAEFRPTGESPLKYHEAFVNTTCPTCGGPAKRESDTMDTFICSSWYFLRYASPDYDKGPFDPAKVKYWLPVDQYTGGAEHACMHLLYARFFTMALRDLGLMDFGEPFTRLFNQGLIIADSRKMSKSRGNVINPDLYVQEMGADTVRAYLMFIGPWDQGGDWNDNGISGMHRFLNRVWNLVLSDEDLRGKYLGEASEAEVRALRRLTHRTVKKVAEDLERFRFNTMLAALMEFTNYLAKARETAAANSPYWKEAIDSLILMLAPAAPHVAEELWTSTGHEYSVHNQRFPVWDEALVKEEEITLVVQVNGKVRDRIVVPASIGEEEVKAQARQLERVQPFIHGREVRNIFYVKGRLVNIVVS
ncbi:MAG: leucine--tRNA ligase [Chloroflexi bacterium]|nr:leucine--tRNA ligase [Chloroflexota bacterium]